MDNSYNGEYRWQWAVESGSFPSISGREEYHGQHPGSAPNHFNASRSTDTLLTPEDLSFDFPVYPGTPVTGRAILACQQGPRQATFPPIGSVAPSGTSVPPGYFSASPLHPERPLAPFDPGFSPCSFPQGLYPVPPRRVDVQPQPVAVPGASTAGHFQPLCAAPMRRQIRTSATLPNVYPPLQKPFLCPVCGVGSLRPQERNRHIESHLPCWVACSFDRCLWTGHRLDTFKKHFCDEHQSAGPGEYSYYRLYDPKPLVEGIVKGSRSVEDAERYAIARLGVMDPVLVRRASGQKRKKLS